MAISTVGPIKSVLHNPQSSAAKKTAIRFAPVTSIRQPSFVRHKGVDALVGFPSITQAFQALKGQDPTPIPAPVGHAIQTLAQQALNALPHAGK